ncbi:MAG: M3 family metallopeptidase [Steroidobacteraceae bacterium]
MKDNPFAAPSALPFHLPPFKDVHDADYMPAFTAGMTEQLREVKAITGNPVAPTFDNTIVAFERSGALLTRVSKVFFNLSQSNTNPAMEKIEREIAPKLAAHRDAIGLDPALFMRIDALYQRRAELNLDPESLQLLQRHYIRIVRGGAKLKDADKAKLRQMNQQLASLSTQFRLNVLEATADGAVVVDTVQELDGLSPAQISAAADAAKERGLKGKYLLALENTTVQPFLANLTNRALRERIYRSSITRATSGPTDNRAVVAQMVRLRAERAQLLGYPTHAAYVLEDETASTAEAVNRILGGIAPVAVAAAKREAAEIQQLIDQQTSVAHTATFALQPWDWDIYSEQIRKTRFLFDQAEVKPYFELDRVLKDGVFYAAHELYGITLKERADLPAYRDDVRVFDVFDANGCPVGLFLADYFARDNKQGGAWMDTFVDPSMLLGDRAVVLNSLNLVKPAKGEPVLLSFAEVITMFHEFGHGLHGLFSHVRYPSLSGMMVPPDFAEYPSQYNEMWAREPVVLAHYAHHYKTGEPMPKALFEKVIAAQKFNEGFKTTSYLAAAMLDQCWHQIGPDQCPPADKVMEFEANALKQAGMDFEPVPARYHSPYFLHIFKVGYEARFYSYLWSEVLARNTGEWLHTHGGMNRANGDYVRAKILSRGRSEEPKDLFQEFYGKPPEIGPLLEYHGLTAE